GGWKNAIPLRSIQIENNSCRWRDGGKQPNSHPFHFPTLHIESTQAWGGSGVRNINHQPLGITNYLYLRSNSRARLDLQHRRVAGADRYFLYEYAPSRLRMDRQSRNR